MSSSDTVSTPKIVVIDDEQPMVELIRTTLTGHDFEVLGATDGFSGLELVAKEQPDLIVLDLMMPGMHGWDVYQKLRSDDATKHIPVIVVTAKSQDIEKVFGLHVAKVEAYLTKPFTPGELVETIRNIL